MKKFQELLEKYIAIYTDQETYFANDIRNLEFYKTNPSNKRLEDIHQKISVIDDKEFKRLEIQDPMAAHILKLNIDPLLEKGELSVVESIASFKLNKKHHNLLHFASVYCNLHRPGVFPVYSNQYANFYKRYILEHKLDLNPDELNTYGVFTQVLNDLVKRYGIKGKMNYLEFRKFAWAYADKIFKEAEGTD
jgi:hypothetical protein